MDADTPLRAKPGPAPRPALQAEQVTGLKYFGLIRKVLASLHTHEDCFNRRLHYDELASLVMLYFLNPVLTSLRSIRQASTLKKVQRTLGVKRTSLGSLSESSRVFDPALLAEVAAELSSQVAPLDAAKRPKGIPEGLAVIGMDGTLLEALPRMAWALWLDEEHRAAKLHLELDLLRGTPTGASLTHAQADERLVLKERLQAGRLYVTDAGYRDYALFEKIRTAGSSFVTRLQDNSVWEEIAARELTDDDRAAGVVFDRVVRLGSPSKRGDLTAPVRVVKVHVVSEPSRGLARRASRVSSKKTFRHRPREYDILLVTDLMEPPAESVALLYRYRWTIELFFRWFKCVLRFQHLIFESRRGMAIMVYCALIVSLLIALWSGRKPTKRTLEMVQLYFQGWAELDELEAHIAALKRDET